jgi:hypothetical protein
LERLAKALYNFYNHQEVIPGLIKSTLQFSKSVLTVDRTHQPVCKIHHS